MRTIHVGLPDRTQAEYGEDQLRALWNQAKVPQNALYWTDGMPDWRPITELFPQPPSPPSTPAPVQPEVPPSVYQQAANQPSAYQAAANLSPVYQPAAGQQPNYQPSYQPPATQSQGNQQPSYPSQVSTPTGYQQPSYQAPGGQSAAYQPPNYQQPAHGAPVSPTPGSQQSNYQSPSHEAPHFGAPAVAPLPVRPGYAGPGAGFRAFVKDPGSLTKTLQVCLWVCVGFSAAGMLSEIATLVGLSGPNATMASAQTGMLLNTAVAILGCIAYIITIVHFSKWIYRANTNVRGFGAQGLEFTPEWAVGYFFIPILMLFKPYQAMAEIWRASTSPSSWQTAKIGGIVGLWWGAFIVARLADNIAGRLAMASDTVTDMQGSLVVTIVSDALDIAAAIVAVQLVKQVYQIQADYVNGRS